MCTGFPINVDQTSCHFKCMLSEQALGCSGVCIQVLSSLEKDEMTSSVTRRSAGLPIIVQTIVQAEKRCKSVR